MNEIPTGLLFGYSHDDKSNSGVLSARLMVLIGAWWDDVPSGFGSGDLRPQLLWVFGGGPFLKFILLFLLVSLAVLFRLSFLDAFTAAATICFEALRQAATAVRLVSFFAGSCHCTSLLGFWSR
jgi:hypothetical protein